MLYELRTLAETTCPWRKGHLFKQKLKLKSYYGEKRKARKKVLCKCLSRTESRMNFQICSNTPWYNLTVWHTRTFRLARRTARRIASCSHKNWATREARSHQIRRAAGCLDEAAGGGPNARRVDTNLITIKTRETMTLFAVGLLLAKRGVRESGRRLLAHRPPRKSW